MTADRTGAPDDPLDAVIADYLQQVEAGAVPDRKALLAGHPELAGRLRDFFTDYDRLDRQAAGLRLSADPDRTTDAPERAGDPPRVRYFGDYELLEVVARGGMGVVYKARQVSLNRPVALKMILHGRLATPRDVARFRTEAEAAANLDHPHIVPIFEVGEHDGRQYYAMRFIEGTSLAGHPRADIHTEARLVATVARAVHFAHQRGLLHRDIKPSNILLDPAGVPYVADFGLAKRLDASGRDLTVTGEAVGTPRYMAPEQAAGRKDLTTAADVYSLGVVLYERLTGTTPFVADNLLELMRQLREADPPRPSSVRPGLDRDLETVCLKCLEKEPGKRYGSAEALADELDRWLRGEPILARPVGALGRFGRWCRRNPAVAGLAGAVAAALLAGTAVSTWFAVAERLQRIKAEAAEAGLEQALARSLIRPLREDGSDLVEPELAALWELAGADSERLRLLFVEETLRTPGTTIQLRRRAESAFIAAVGLDPKRREQAERLLTDAMHDPARSMGHRTDVAWIVLELTGPGSPVRRACAEVIGQGFAVETNPNTRAIWQDLLRAKAGRFDPTDAARLLGEALERGEAHASARVGRLMEANDLERLVVLAGDKRSLAEALGRDVNATARAELAREIVVVAGRLEPPAAAEVCRAAARVLADALRRDNSASARAELARELAAVAGHLEASEAAGVCGAAARVLAEALERDADAFTRRELARGLAAVAGRLEAGEAAGVCGAAARVLAEALGREADAYARMLLAFGLAAVAGHLEPADAARVFAEALGREADAFTRRELAQGLAAVAGRLEAGEAAGVCGAAARVLAEALGHEGNASARAQLSWGLAELAGHLEATEAARVLAEALGREADTPARAQLARGLAAMAGRLEAAEAARVFESAAHVLAEALEREVDASARAQLARELAAVAERLEPPEAARMCGAAARVLAEALRREGNASARAELARGLAAVAGHLDAAEADLTCLEAVRRLVQYMERKNDVSNQRQEESAVVLLLSHVSDADAAGAAKSFASRIAADPRSSSTFFWFENDRAVTLNGLLTQATRPQVRPRSAAVAAAVAVANGGLMAALCALPAAGEPLPCRLSTQDLVELLKYPTCVGDVRKVVLTHLGNRYGRHFADHWQFVRFARETGLDLDFTTPPKRPEGALPPLFGE
jgi:tRNA A-37 threonylcarbamoyl transferase component Bud32